MRGGSGVGVRCGAGTGGAIADDKEGQVVGLACPARKILHGLENTFLKLIEGTLGLASKDFAEAGDAEELLVRIHGFGDPIAEEDERVARFESQTSRRVFGLGDEPHRIRALAERFLGDAMANQEWRRMPGIDEFEVAVVIQNAKKHRRITADFSMIAEKAIDMVEDARGIGAQSHGRKRALEHGREKSGAETLA